MRRLVARLRDEASLTESAEQELTRPPLSAVGAKAFSPVFAKGADQVFIELLKAEMIGREPFIQLKHDPNDALAGIAGVPVATSRLAKPSKCGPSGPLRQRSRNLGSE